MSTELLPELLPEPLSPKFRPILGLSNHQRTVGHGQVQEGPVFPKNISDLGILNCGF